MASLKAEQAKQAAIADTTTLFYTALNGQAQDIVLKNDKVALTLNTKICLFSKLICVCVLAFSFFEGVTTKISLGADML